MKSALSGSFLVPHRFGCSAGHDLLAVQRFGDLAEYALVIAVVMPAISARMSALAQGVTDAMTNFGTKVSIHSGVWGEALSVMRHRRQLRSRLRRIG